MFPAHMSGAGTVDHSDLIKSWHGEGWLLGRKLDLPALWGSGEGIAVLLPQDQHWGPLFDLNLSTKPYAAWSGPEREVRCWGTRSRGTSWWCVLSGVACRWQSTLGTAGKVVGTIACLVFLEAHQRPLSFQSLPAAFCLPGLHSRRCRLWFAVSFLLNFLISF